MHSPHVVAEAVVVIVATTVGVVVATTVKIVDAGNPNDPITYTYLSRVSLLRGASCFIFCHKSLYRPKSRIESRVFCVNRETSIGKARERKRVTTTASRSLTSELP